MIFCGDIALPFVGSIDYSSIPLSIREKTWFGNLEGSLLIDSSAYCLGRLFSMIMMR